MVNIGRLVISCLNLLLPDFNAGRFYSSMGNLLVNKGWVEKKLQHFFVAFGLTVISFLGILSVCRYIGEGTGTAFTGLLFEVLEPQSALFCYGVSTAVVFALYCMFIFFSKDIEEYEILRHSEVENDLQ